MILGCVFICQLTLGIDLICDLLCYFFNFSVRSVLKGLFVKLTITCALVSFHPFSFSCLFVFVIMLKVIHSIKLTNALINLVTIILVFNTWNRILSVLLPFVAP